MIAICKANLEQKLAALRNRENQRRSRARRKDYIQELEQKLRQYELAGVKATTEVQGAARKVAEENISLRALLGLYGADNGRIEAFLRKGDVSFIEKEYSSPLSSEGIGQDICTVKGLWMDQRGRGSILSKSNQMLHH